MMLGAPIWRGDGRVGRAISKAMSLGFDFVEIDLETIRPSEVSIKVKDVAHGYHAPYTIFLSHSYPEMEKAAVKTLNTLLRHARRTGAEYLNIHLNFPSYRRLDSLTNRMWRAALRNLRGLARDGGVEITVENTPRHGWDDAGFFEDAVKVRGVSLCLDVGHVVSRILEEEGLDEALKTLRRWFRRFKGRIHLLHLHNVMLRKGKAVDHVPEGLLDLSEVIDMAERSGCGRVLLEVFVDKDGRGLSLEDMARVAGRILRR